LVTLAELPMISESNKNIFSWKELRSAKGRPLYVLAPMADVTDAAFRRIITKYSSPDAVWTEFVSADGLALAPELGRQKLLLDLIYTEQERPIIAQFFSSRPENMEKAARLAVEMGFDGIDINMGCPDSSIEKQGAGAAHIKNPSLAQEVILAAKQGARIPNELRTSTEEFLDVSVKTRVGYNKVELDTWLPKILETKPSLVTIHARTRKEMSLVPARFEHVKEAVHIRNSLAPDTLIFGNGDVRDIAHGAELARETSCDGLMLGRAIFGNPWLFNDSNYGIGKAKVDTVTMHVRHKLEVMIEHTKLFEELFKEKKSFAIMRKHYKAYVTNFDGAVELRTDLMKCETAEEVERITNTWLQGRGL
jgi:nifR3 family TIM-barrel protein